ncbi:LuxR C-terminal-related transcriptional regulator [Pseudomonas sp. NPDC090201]|uniref:LuxR C-terminal-related transcriptional regulator n=1 Tax=Pseudomonas sp. NPDC090201 TaxID=3364475 RepID=UPI0038075601
MTERKRKYKRPNRTTPREQEVLQLLLAGYTNKGIAQALGISDYTARDHVSALLKKNEVHNRAQLMALHVSPRVRKQFEYPLHLTDCIGEPAAHNEGS